MFERPEGKTPARKGYSKGAYRVLVRKLERNRALGTYKHIWKDNLCYINQLIALLCVPKIFIYPSTLKTYQFIKLRHLLLHVSVLLDHLQGVQCALFLKLLILLVLCQQAYGCLGYACVSG